ncbi:hypothetical protein BDN71DRAFT_1436206 [Pleurotus eryngii]|uniref:Uncharacterized protein n=1 Tax=Pleurotus eryngii TaxID=5323 RepID=A0A9P5ZM40_PLEER|nr:hypothetical protein BDN71DRAFT_1436206 [Pleurotus eryngii]
MCHQSEDDAESQHIVRAYRRRRGVLTVHVYVDDQYAFPGLYDLWHRSMYSSRDGSCVLLHVQTSLLLYRVLFALISILSHMFVVVSTSNFTKSLSCKYAHLDASPSHFTEFVYVWGRSRTHSQRWRDYAHWLTPTLSFMAPAVCLGLRPSVLSVPLLRVAAFRVRGSSAHIRNPWETTPQKCHIHDPLPRASHPAPSLPHLLLYPKVIKNIQCGGAKYLK